MFSVEIVWTFKENT